MPVKKNVIRDVTCKCIDWYISLKNFGKIRKFDTV